MLAKWEIVAQQFDIVIGETDLHARFVAPGLLRCAPREHAHCSGAEALENNFNRFPEAVAVREKKDNGSNAPCHARHSEHSLAHVVAHCGIGLLEKVAVHVYSLRKASTGSSSAARRAGYKPAATPAIPSEMTASAAVDATSFGVETP